MKKSSEKPRFVIWAISELLSGISVSRQHLMHPYRRQVSPILLIESKGPRRQSFLAVGSVKPVVATLGLDVIPVPKKKKAKKKPKK
jgi:hypothetical protein